MPEAAYCAFIGMQFPYIPIFFEIIDHFLRLIERIVHCLFAGKIQWLYPSNI